MAPPKDQRSPPNAMSDDEVSITLSVESEEQEEYLLDKILAETMTSKGRRWLVQWEGYPEERSTWEPKSSFTSEQPLEDWKVQKMRIARGYAKPYDVAAFEKRVRAIEKARAIRIAKRRAKRIRLGLSEPSESDELDSSEEAEESDDDIPPDRPTRSQRGSLRKLDPSLNDFVIEDDQIVGRESPRKGIINRSHKSPVSDSETGDHLSDDSLVEDLRAKEFNKSHKRLKKIHKPRSELFISKSPEPPSRHLPQARTASMQSPPSRQMSPVGAQRRQSQPSRQIPPAGTDRRHIQPSKKITPAGLDRRQSMPTLSSSKYSGTMNRATGQLKGAMGTGPKRYAKKQSKYQGKPKVQGAAIMGRWDASAKPRKLTTVIPGLVPSLNAKTFGKLSIQRKYEKAGRNEPAPNPENLTFINPRKDKAGPRPIIMPKRNTSPVKTAWEIYQERLKNETTDLGDTGNQIVVEPDVGEDVRMDVDSDGELDMTHTTLQPVSITGSKERVETGRSGQPIHTTEHQMKDLPLKTNTSETKADMPSEQAPNSAAETARKSSVSFHSQNSGEGSVHERFENRIDNDASCSGAGPNPEVSVPTGPRSTQDHISDADAKPLLATIRVGHEGHRVGAVRLKGIPWQCRTMLLRTKVEGQLEVWCGVSCTVKDYKRYHNGPDSKPFATGVVEPFYDSAPAIHAMAATLNAHASGGLYLQDQFALLMYPSDTVNWAFLDPNIQASPNLGLKFIMRSPLLQPFHNLPEDLLQDKMLTKPISLPDELKINTVLRHLFNVDYKTLVSQNAKKTKEPNTFFLVFPASCNDEHELVVRFLEANRAIIYSSHIPGSWEYFTSHIDTGVILIHPSFDAYHLVPSLPATLKKNINVFSIGTSIEPTIDPTSSPPYKITNTPHFACERLFPHGGAILVTESVFLNDPKAARYILRWFKESLIKKPAGTWKLICRPGIKQWMAELVDEVPEDRALYTELYSLLTTISPTSATASTNHENESPLVTPSALLETYTSHPTPTLKAAFLVEWFAGWANCHVHAFRRFHVVHPVVVERWGERWRTLDLLTPEDFEGMYRLSGHSGGGGEGGGDAGRRRKSVGS